MDSMKIRYNVIQINSILGFVNIRGGFVKENKDVYFIREIGCSGNYLDEIKKMDEAGNRLKQQKGGYLRISELPILSRPEDIEYYNACYQQWKKGEAFSLRAKEKSTDRLWDSQLMWACRKVSRMFEEGMAVDSSLHMAAVSESMVKNFMLKMLYQTDRVASELFREWDIHRTYKFVYAGNVKKHEYLFCYFLTLLGIDVMLLLPQGDVMLPKMWLDLSACVTLGGEREIKIPELNVATVTMVQDMADATAKHTEKEEHAEQAEHTEQAEYTEHSTKGISGESTAVESVRREKSFEELAALASSIVMIASHDKNGNVIGTGSGIMIAQDGYILTNNHVIAGGAFFSVRIEEEEQIYQTDEVIKYNHMFDLALIRIERPLVPLPIYCDTKKLVRGQKVVAIGSPLGLFNSVSDGIISGFRHFENVDMMQFTAPISHGSSGGAVLNMYGELIGISTAGMDDGQNLNLAVDYNYILQFGKGIYS